MIKMPKAYMIEKIKEKSGLSDEEINARINKKLEELSGLISEDGAAHIVANELGIKFMEASENLQIKSLFAGMRNIDIIGKVTRIYEVRSFQSGERSGKVGSFMFGDATGVLRVTCWGTQADNMSKLKENDVVRIKGGYAKENAGKIEIHLNDYSNIIINPEGANVGEVKTRAENTRKKISELSGSDQNVEILGTIVQVFDPRFFEVCPHCQKRIKMQENSFYCETHKAIATPDYSYVINATLDDSSETIRAIFFRNQMQHLVNMTHEQILSKRGNSFEEVKNDLLGKIIRVIGRASTNAMFSRIEFVAQIVDSNPSANAELQRLDSLNSKPKIEEKLAPKVEVKKPFEEPKPVIKPASKVEPKKKDEDEDVMSIDDIDEINDDDIYE